MKTHFRIFNVSKAVVCLGLIAATATTSCSNDDSDTGTGGESSASTKYFIAAENGEGTYFLAVESLSEGTTTTTGNGIEDPNAYTHYAYNGNEAVIALSYRQGNPALGTIYGLNATGDLEEIGAGFQMTNGYSSLGPFENYIIATKSGVTFSDNSTGANFYFIDLDNDAAVSSKQLTTQNLVGNGLETSLVGIVDAGDGSFLSAVEVTDGDINECYVVKLDADLNVLAVMNDDRIGRASGQWRSARYPLIANDATGNSYVFANPIGGTTNGGALKINQGATGFDSSYYFDIQAQASGYSFRKVWHVTGDYFMLEFYNELEPTTNTGAYQYAIVNMNTQSFTWISGLPAVDTISDIGWPFTGDDLVYIPVTTNDANPIVYVVDPTTATAVPGIEVESATSIGGLAKLTY